MKKQVIKDIEKDINACVKCGPDFAGKSAIGFGHINSPSFMMVGMNPWTKNHKFVNGKGITILLDHLKEWKFTDFYFDNVVKCEMPDKGQPLPINMENCSQYLLRQIDIIQPKRIIAFGRFSHSFFRNFKLQIPVIFLAHFSSIFYGHPIVDSYYEKLRKVLKI